MCIQSSAPSKSIRNLEEIGQKKPLNKGSSGHILSAYHNLEPARIAWGSVDVPDHVFIRRWIMKDSVYNPKRRAGSARSVTESSDI